MGPSTVREGGRSGRGPWVGRDRIGQLGQQELAPGDVLAAEWAAPDERARFGLGDRPAGPVLDEVVLVAERAEVDALGGAAGGVLVGGALLAGVGGAACRATRTRAWNARRSRC